MSDFILTTYDWVPETPRGYVRDLRIRWALEEAKLPYQVEVRHSKIGIPTISNIIPLVRYRG